MHAHGVADLTPGRVDYIQVASSGCDLIVGQRNLIGLVFDDEGIVFRVVQHLDFVCVLERQQWVGASGAIQRASGYPRGRHGRLGWREEVCNRLFWQAGRADRAQRVAPLVVQARGHDEARAFAREQHSRAGCW
ncbi:hypothetical protein D3C80_1417090 [compost metagenome]